MLNVSLKVDVAKTRHVDQSSIEVYPSSGALPGNRLWKINLPPQSIVEDQFARDTKGVLAIEEPSILTFSRIVDAACKAAERAHTAEQERG